MTLPTPPAAGRDFLKSEHPVHKAWDPIWKMIERGMKGGAHMRSALRRYAWENANSEKGRTAYNARVEQATYINLPDMYLTSMVGQLARRFPQPGSGLDFGSLGSVETEVAKIRGRAPTRAELVYYNCDGVGNDGSQWDKWWIQSAKLAAGFGHIWTMTESAPASLDPARVRTRLDEMRGVRPYLVRFSPSRVWDWHFENGELQFAIIRTATRRPRKNESGGMDENAGNQYLLLTRQGWGEFGSEYAGGGFWLYDSDLKPVQRNSADVKGDWAAMRGAIPLSILYGERDDGSEDMPAISRPGVSELLSIAISYMNLSSAADFEAWDAAKGVEYVLNVNQKNFNSAVEIMEDGSRLVPFEASGPDAKEVRIQASNMATTPSDVFKARLDTKRIEGELHGLFSPSSSPDSSGLSKAVGFAENKAPRLALLASEVESNMNAKIYELERRFDTQLTAPTGVASIPRDFNLLETSDAMSAVFDEVVKIEAKSATLFSYGIRTMLKEKVGIKDEKLLNAIESEIKKGVENADQLASRIAEIADAERGDTGAGDGGEGGAGSQSDSTGSSGGSGVAPPASAAA